MTDKELEDLKEKHSATNKEIWNSTGIYNYPVDEKKLKALRTQQENLYNQIVEEEKRRHKEANPNYEVDCLRKCVEGFNRKQKDPPELWYIRAGKEKKLFETTKGKYLWTTKGRAIRALYDELPQHRAVDCFRDDYMNIFDIDIKGAIKKLIEEGYIEIKRFV